MRKWIEFHIVKAARLLELYSIRRKIDKNRKRLPALVNVRINPYKELMQWLDKSFTEIQDEIDIWKSASNEESLTEKMEVWRENRIRKLAVEIEAVLGVSLPSDGQNLDPEAVKVLEALQVRLMKTW